MSTFAASRAGGAPSLADLVSQSRKLTTSIERDRNGLGSELPSIQLGLDQLESQSRTLATGGSGPQGASADSRAHYFLASAGIDAFTLAQNVNQTNIASAFEPLEPLQDTDVQGYLQHEQQQTILSAIDEGRRETLSDFHRNLSRTMQSRWSQQKRKIFDELGQHQAGPSSSSAAASRSYAGASLPSTSADPPLSSLSMHTKLMSYDSLIRSLNQARLKSNPFPLATELLRLAQSSVGAPGETQTQLAECWMALRSIVGEEDRKVPREREYAQAYIDPSHYYGSAEGRELRRQIAKGSMHFLEAQFETHVDNIIASNPSKAQLGGQPGISSRVAAFLRVSHLSREGRWAPELELVKTSPSAAALPVWASIYYLLRTGHSTDALRLTEEHEDAFRRGDAGFVPWFKEWIESGGRGLSRTSRDRFFAEFNARFRGLNMDAGSGGDPSGIDPYKLALYRLLGRVDPTRKFPSALTRSTENWLWLQMMMTREPSVGSSGVFGGSIGADSSEDDERERYTIEDLARKLRTYGEKHFDPKGRRPLHYFLVLLLSGELERALGFLYSRSAHQTDAVHFGVALAYYGLLRPPSAATSRASMGAEILTAKADAAGREVPHLDFARLITRHIRLFASSDARSALEYLYLICLNVDDNVPSDIQDDQRQKCYAAIKDLVCQTRMYAELVGDVRVDGARIPGAIEQNLQLLRLKSERDYLRQIVQAAASQSEAEHRTRDAILLYNLAEEYDTVVGVLNRELGASLFSVDSAADAPSASQQALNPSTSLSAAEDASQLARAIMDTYDGQNHIIRQVQVTKRTTCRLLLELKRAVQMARSGELEKSLNAIEATNLFPIAGSNDVVSISRRAESFFRELDESVGQNLSDLLMMTMDLLYKVHNSVKTGSNVDVDSPPTSALPPAPPPTSGREARLMELRNKARALMMFAGMLRFRIEQAVFAQLTRLDAYIR